MLKFSDIKPFPDISFWVEFAKNKLEKYKLSEEGVNIFGRYSPANKRISNILIQRECLIEGEVTSIGGLIESEISGTIINLNTIEKYKKFDHKSLFDKRKTELMKIFEDGANWLANPGILNQFQLITFVDLKKYQSSYNFGFPTFEPLNMKVKKSTSISNCFPLPEVGNISKCILQKFQLVNEKHKGIYPPIFNIKKLKDNWELCSMEEFYSQFHEGKVEYLITFLDASHMLPTNVIKNFLAALTFKLQKDGIEGNIGLKFLALRGQFPKLSEEIFLTESIYFEIEINKGTVDFNSELCGWNLDKSGELEGKEIDLKQIMDPKLLAENAVGLNLKLMKWRMAPELDLEKIKNCKCLLLGAGSLGCQVARNLMAWGVETITFVDSGTISYSNPVRQSLFCFNDCIGQDKFKCEVAAAALKEIYPSVNAQGHVLRIPMPGHSLSTPEALEGTLEDVGKLERLIAEHDAVFLLTDSRESRWFPTVVAECLSKICITVALGFDTYVVMRHGLSQQAHDPKINGDRLGCYFCNDIVAPNNSMLDRTLDQQCTVSRPALCTMGSSMGVELLASILNHPLKAGAPGNEDKCENGSSVLGIIPQQIRGNLFTFETNVLMGPAFNSCVACSQVVIEEYQMKRNHFVVDVINKPDFLQDLTGITAMMAKVDLKDIEEIVMDDF